MYQSVIEGPNVNLRFPRKPAQHRALPPLAADPAVPSIKTGLVIDADLATKVAAVLLIGGVVAVGVMLGLAGVV
jgi:hypothetical protein